MWYMILDNHFLVIGDENGIITSYPFITSQWRIDIAICNIQNNVPIKFAIAISNPNNPIVKHTVLTHNGIYKNAEIIYNHVKDDFALVAKLKYGEAMAIYNYDTPTIDWDIYSHSSKKFQYVKCKGRKELTVTYNYTEGKNKEKEAYEQKDPKPIDHHKIAAFIATSYDKPVTTLTQLDDESILFLCCGNGNLYKVAYKE